MKGFIPGATSATPSTYAIPSGKTNDPTAGMSKAQKKNYQRKVKRMEEKTARNWDSESEEEGEGEGEEGEGTGKATRSYEVKRVDSDEEPNDRFDIHRTSSDERLDREIDEIEIPELGKKPEFGVGFNKYRDPIKGPRKDIELEEKKEEKTELKSAKPPRPGGIFRDLGLKPKSSGTTPTQATATATEKVKLAPVVTTKPKRTVPGAAVPGASTKPTADKNTPRQRPEVRVRPGMGLAGMMKQLAVQDSTPSVRR